MDTKTWMRKENDPDERLKAKPPVFQERESVQAFDYADGTGEMRKVLYADWVCPVCGWFVGEMYLPRKHNQQKSNYCSRCGQAIDWTKITREEWQAVQKRKEELLNKNRFYFPGEDFAK